MNETLLGILTYDGCSTDIALNYVALVINTLTLIRLCHHLQSTYTYRSIRHVWILLTLFLLMFQVVLCLFVGCSGISIIWSAQIGFCWSFRTSYFQSAETFLLHLLLGISTLLDCGLWIYYYVIADQLTSIAHGCAVLLGILLAWIVHQMVTQRTYTTLETKILTMNEIPIQPEVFGVEVRDSWIPGSGKGLFATTSMSKGHLICQYIGHIMTTTEAMRTHDKSYLMRLGGFTYVDAKASPECLARYINDCRNPLGYNVTFVKKPEEHCADIIATRDISIGEELFADYGKWYWIGMSPNRLSLAQLLKLRGIVT